MQTSEWREQWAGNVHSPEDFVRFINAVGCCTRLPMPRYPDFPDQATVVGKLEPGSTDTWFWKDDLHAEKRLYYTRVFGGQPGFLSNSLLPALIATNGMTFDELDYAGLLTAGSMRQIYAVIEAHGPIPIRQLKRLLTPDAQRAADRTLTELERRFIITKTGITGRTRGTYGFIWDLVERWMPDMLTAADRLGHKQATAVIQNHLAGFGISAGSEFYARCWDGHCDSLFHTRAFYDSQSVGLGEVTVSHPNGGQ